MSTTQVCARMNEYTRMAVGVRSEISHRRRPLNRKLNPAVK
jgi:hypothetical protein